MKFALLLLAPLAVVVFAGHAAGQSGGQTAPPSLLKPPATRVEPVRETLHGVEIVDNYRWLEGDNSNPERMGQVTPEVGAWTDQQNAHTRSVLDNLPGRKALEEKLRPLMEVGSVSTPTIRGGRYFFSRREGTQNQPSYYWRQGYKGDSKLLLDPAQLDPSGLTTITWIAPSHDGQLVAYGTYKAGDENTTLYLMEVETGKLLPLQIPNKTQAPDWLPDGSGFVYQNLKDPKDPYSGRVLYHRMGTDVAADPILFRQYTKEENEKLATTWGPGGSLSRDGRWLTLVYWTGTRSNDLWVADFQQFLATGKLEKREVAIGQEGTSFGLVDGDTLFVQTNLGAPNGRVDAYDLRSKSAGGAWKPQTVVAERPGMAIQSISLARGLLAVEYLKNATSVIEVFDASAGSAIFAAGALSGTPAKSLGELAMPGIGSAGLATESDRTEAYLKFTSFNYPTTIFRVDLGRPALEPELWERPPVPVDPSTVEVKQVWYSSKDGTKVSMFVVHKKGLALDGNNPTLLKGYGGFNVSETPDFSATMFQWFDAGGVMALPNLRGGGEYGDAWHEAGMLAKKQNVFDDFYAAAEWLVAERYTSPAKLAIAGGSNGGLLTGVAVIQRPELFRAALVAVPLLDMLRYQNFLMARYWVPEYGSAEDAAQFGFLQAYSPYQKVQSGTPYPAVLLTAGENDMRVHALHARKMAAALQAASASDPAEKPVLLWVDREAGHGQGKPLNLRIRDAADQRIFFMWQLGMLPKS
ncbi:MAG: S9 family peptidase [Kofleriaceae bacterium]|nr:S9 family peptidase [Kofleriaceae bacterium]